MTFRPSMGLGGCSASSDLLFVQNLAILSITLQDWISDMIGTDEQYELTGRVVTAVDVATKFGCSIFFLL